MDPQLEAFIVEIRPWLHKKALILSKDRTNAEDLVQEVSARFLQAFGGVTRLPTVTVLERWLIATMTHCFIDQCRKQTSEKQGAKDPTLERWTMGQRSEPKRLSETISDEDFDAAMKKLSPALRTTIELRLTGKRYHEIADVLRIPISSVGKRLSDGRKQLLRFLTPSRPSGDQ